MIGVNNVSVQKTGLETPCLSMRPKEAARALGISERLLWDWVRRGVVPHVRIGGVVVFPTDSLRDWLQQQVETGRVDGEEKSEVGT